MASVDPNTKTTYATTDWEFYQKGRPPYPPSLTKIIYDYRRRHANAGWERLVDVGAGNGVAATNFMADFKVIHNSDPSPSNEDQARAFLTKWAESHGLNPTLEYSQASGEGAHTKAGEHQADLAICATAAHFVDADGLAASIAKLLRPGGTLAVYSYWMPRFPGRSQHFHDVFERTFDTMVLTPLSQSGDESNRSRLEKVVNRRMTGKGVLDSLPLPEELYADPQRVYINAGTSDIPFTGLYRKFMAPKQLGGDSRVSPRDQIVHYDLPKDPEAEGWLFDVDKKFLANFFDTIRPASGRDSEESKRAYAEWEQSFDRECPDGTVSILWPAYLALATRK